MEKKLYQKRETKEKQPNNNPPGLKIRFVYFVRSFFRSIIDFTCCPMAFLFFSQRILVSDIESKEKPDPRHNIANIEHMFSAIA